HCASRPWNELIAWTINFQQPLVNLFLTGDNQTGAVTGRVFDENVKEAPEHGDVRRRGPDSGGGEILRPERTARRALLSAGGGGIRARGRASRLRPGMVPGADAGGCPPAGRKGDALAAGAADLPLALRLQPAAHDGGAGADDAGGPGRAFRRRTESG